MEGNSLPGPTLCLFASMTEVNFGGLPWPGLKNEANELKTRRKITVGHTYK